MNRFFAGFGYEGEALDTDEIAYVEQFLEDGIVECRVIGRTDVVATYVDLYPAGVVLDFEE